MAKKPYRVYDVFTGEELGDYDSEYEASSNHAGEPVTVRYQPSKRRKK